MLQQLLFCIYYYSLSFKLNMDWNNINKNRLHLKAPCSLQTSTWMLNMCHGIAGEMGQKLARVTLPLQPSQAVGDYLNCVGSLNCGMNPYFTHSSQMSEGWSGFPDQCNIGQIKCSTFTTTKNGWVKHWEKELSPYVDTSLLERTKKLITW